MTGLNLNKSTARIQANLSLHSYRSIVTETMKKGFLKNKKTGISTKNPGGIGSVKKEVIIGNGGLSTVEDHSGSSVSDKSAMNSSETQKEALRRDAGVNFVKLPFGKVDTALPANYEKFTPEISEYNSRTVDYPEDQVIITTLPPRPTDQDFAIGANSWAECLLQGSKQKRSILSIPGFPHSVPHFTPPRYRIGSSEHGQGMFATSKLEAGDLIFAERPIIVIPQAIPFPDIEYPEGITQAEMLKIQLTEFEKLLEMCVGRMLPQDKKAFFELCDSHTEDGSGPILGRVRTNGFGIEFEAKDGEPHSATFIAASRMNHSCIANVSRRFDRPSFSLHLYAARTIEAGEELCVNYSSTYHPRSQRQSKLLPYGFHCTCPACSDPNFDSRLAGVMRSYAKLYSRSRGLENTQEALDESLFAIEEIEALGLEEQAGYYKHLSRAAVMAGLLKKKELSTMLLEKVQKRQMMATGKPLMNLAAADMKQLMDRARESNGWVIKAF